ncbi:MAG: hypothetical protein CMP98_06995 [Gammaproteobacteria bacterium]|nr:hypothetical protein [Gammaproteobacteria bacterium]OUU09682.1 MAG: hypothetical protein CBB94_07155 [Gammaproteobacteria bacterium TMED34]
MGLSGESIPVEDNQFGDVVITCTLCAIPDHHQTLAEIRRVLEAGWRMIFSEHGPVPEVSVQKYQSVLEYDLWRLQPGTRSIWARYVKPPDQWRALGRMVTGVDLKLGVRLRGSTVVPVRMFASG